MISEYNYYIVYTYSSLCFYRYAYFDAPFVHRYITRICTVNDFDIGIGIAM